VRRRRLEQPGTEAPSPLTNPEAFTGENAAAFPPKMEDEFQTLRARGGLVGDEAEARAKFLEGNAAWRQRVRGGRGIVDPETNKPRPDGKLAFIGRGGERPAEEGEVEAIMGQKIYLPNIQIRLMRNHTPVGEAYDPWVATFRMPQNMTKNDLRSYLHAVYGLEVTFIRTDNYLAPLQRYQGGEIKRPGGSKKNYKRAVVGLKEPFHYPDDVEEMRAGTWGGLEAGSALADARMDTIESEYAITQVKEYRDFIKNKMNKRVVRWRSKDSNAVSMRMSTSMSRLAAVVASPPRLVMVSEYRNPTASGYDANTNRATPSARSCVAASSASRPLSPRPARSLRLPSRLRNRRLSFPVDIGESLGLGDCEVMVSSWSQSVPRVLFHTNPPTHSLLRHSSTPRSLFAPPSGAQA
jgi:large subunit ribosomal protein L23